MFCGLDFGTSNTTIGITQNNQCQLVPLEGNKPSIRSAVFCDNDLKQWFFGQEGVNQYLEGYNGRLMMAIKSILGSSLMTEKTVIFNEFVSFTTVLSQFLLYIKQQAEAWSQQSLTQVVMGRPVRFHDQDDHKDALAQKTLALIAHEIGFKDVVFQYEPIAAAIAYEQTIDAEQLALIVDIGGGTSDFTVIRLCPGNTSYDRSGDVISNCGIHIAGTDFDKMINLKTVMPLLGMGSTVKNKDYNIEVPSSFYHDLTTWYMLHQLYERSTIHRIKAIRATANEKHLLSRLIDVLQNRLGHYILNNVENSKQLLSDDKQVLIALDLIENNLQVTLTRDQMNAMLTEHVSQIVHQIEQTIRIASVKPSAINAVFYTGGSTKILAIQEKINALFPTAKIIHGDVFGSVGLGLTIEAKRKYG